ncbi:MAG: enterotoxin, partial [Acidihalobacter sp.]
ERLREAEPDLSVNLTTGTYPSPFWLRYADSTWRGGSDHSFAGVGSKRQQWITYRDAATYRGVVQRGPLYPLNALMLHGLIYAQHARGLSDDPGHDFRSEVRDYFGTGTQLQEMYITPSLLSVDDWDAIAAWVEAREQRKAA